MKGEKKKTVEEGRNVRNERNENFSHFASGVGLSLILNCMKYGVLHFKITACSC